MYQHSRESTRIIIGFYGGEPLLKFDLIKKCAFYIEKLFYGEKSNIYNYNVFCKHFLEKNAKYFWRMLHLQIGESCKASAGSYSASYIAIADHI